MSNRNFDSRVIIQRLQDKNYARNTFQYNTLGQLVINNPQTTNGNASNAQQFAAGSQTTYMRGLVGGCVTVNTGGTLGLGGAS